MPATRRSLRRRWWVVAAFAVTAGVLLVVAVSQQRADSRRAGLQRTGVHADGIVVSVDAHPVGRGRFPYGSVSVRFDAAGEITQHEIGVGTAVADYQPGQQVRVVFDEADPSRVELAGVTSATPGMPAAVAFAVGLLFAGITAAVGRNALRIGRVVRHEPWRVLRSGIVQVPLSLGARRGSRTLVVLETPNGDVTVEPIGLSRIDPTFAPEAWVAGLDGRTMVLAVPGGGHVLAARRRPAPTEPA